MKDQGEIQNFCFQIRILLVRPQNTENIFRCGKFLFGIMYIKALSLDIMIICLISVDRKQRKYADQV